MSGPQARPGVPDSDLAIVSGQLGRTARDVTCIAVRCPWGRPAVIETAPRLGGRPNPTLLYLTCPTATATISTAEAGGGVKRLKALARDDAQLRGALHELIHAYKRRRADLAPEGDPRPEAGIGGPTGPEEASCLHAYAAALLAALSGWFAEGPAAAAGQAWDRFLPARDTLWCADDRCARWAPVPRVAVIDIGTISVRLLVADIRAGRPEQLHREAHITRLGEGLRPGEPLDPAARQRTAAAVRGFVAGARSLGTARILLAGTSACREAADGQDFVQTLGEELGAGAIVLTGEAEAALAYAGASLDAPDHAVVLDVGGGSTELIRRTPDGTVESVSLPLGASRGTERWIRSDPPMAAEMRALLDDAAALVEPLRERFGAEVAGPEPAGRPHGTDPHARREAEPGAGASRPQARDAMPACLVGVAGTVTTLACLDAGLDDYDAEIIHLRDLSLPSVDRLVDSLAAMTTVERAALPCVQAGRAPVIVGGALVVKATMEVLGYQQMTISERDILDGLALAAAC